MRFRQCGACILLFFLFSLSYLAASPAYFKGVESEAKDESLTNESVLKLKFLAFSPEVIITKIRSSQCSFDTSVDALATLKKAGVSDEVIVAMIEAQEQAVPAAAPTPERKPTPHTQASRMMFKKVEVRNNYGHANQGNDGKLIVTSDLLRFVKNNENQEYFSIPTQAISEVFYSRVSGRRIKTAIFVALPLLFSKGKKHYMTLSFNDGGSIVGAVEFRLHKSNYRGVLHAMEQVSGVPLKFDQEGVSAEQEGIAASGAASSATLTTVDFGSTPEGAEIEINGAYSGTTPRVKTLSPGEYKIKITKNGYKSWEKKIQVKAGEEFPLTVELEKK